MVKASLLRAAIFTALGLWGLAAWTGDFKSRAGLELGGNGTFLFSDASVGTFGAGAGYQYSLTYGAWVDRPISGKVRIESLSLRENIDQKTSSEYVSPATFLKTMTQNWTVISAGAEGGFGAQGQTFFWEALLGYAIGGTGTVSVTNANQPSTVSDYSQHNSSFLALSGGLGLRKGFTKAISGVMTLRSFFLFRSPYDTTELNNRGFIPFPLMFNLGAEYAFD
jgi:hypothetical protein